MIEIVDEVRQPDRVDVEHRRRVRVRPHLRRIAGDDQHVAQANGRRAQQVAEHAEQVPVATGVVRHRLDADLLLDQHAGQQRAHPALRARTVGHVHRVDAGDLELRDVEQHPRRVDAARRHDLDRRHERAVGDLLRPPRPLGERNRLRPSAPSSFRRVAPAARAAALPARPAARPRSRLQRPNPFAHRADVIRRRSAAPADDLRAGLREMARVGGEILGARHVHLAALDLARHAGVRLRAQLPRRHRGHLLDALENRLRPDGAIEADDVRAPGVERFATSSTDAPYGV